MYGFALTFSELNVNLMIPKTCSSCSRIQNKPEHHCYVKIETYLWEVRFLFQQKRNSWYCLLWFVSPIWHKASIKDLQIWLLKWKTLLRASLYSPVDGSGLLSEISLHHPSIRKNLDVFISEPGISKLNILNDTLQSVLSLHAPVKQIKLRSRPCSRKSWILRDREISFWSNSYSLAKTPSG